MIYFETFERNVLRLYKLVTTLPILYQRHITGFQNDFKRYRNGVCVNISFRNQLLDSINLKVTMVTLCIDGVPQRCFFCCCFCFLLFKLLKIQETFLLILKIQVSNFTIRLLLLTHIICPAYFTQVFHV